MQVDYLICNDTCEKMNAVAHWGGYLLPDSWLKRLEEAQQPQHFLLARMLLLRRLTLLGFDYTSLPEMKYTTSGKPYFDIPIHFNITYNKKIILLAVSEHQPMGIDVETIRPVSWQSYKMYFAAEDWLKIKRAPRPTIDLIHAWVIKEAANKLEGIKSLSVKKMAIKIREKRLQLNGRKYYHEKINLPASFIAKIVTQNRVKHLRIQNVTNEITSQSMLYVVRA